jgi:hypothetical protein
MPVILSWEAEIGRFVVSGQSRQMVRETPSPKITIAKMYSMEVWLKQWRLKLSFYKWKK